MTRLVALCSGALLLWPASGLGQDAPDPPAALVDRAPQHLLVITEAPGNVAGRLYRMERVEEGWRQVGAPLSVVVGRSGVGPKQEGDGRSPQGVFELGRAFGYAAEPPPGLTLSYEAQAPGAVCVDDVDSRHYNRVFDADTLSAARDWSSFEAMRRDLAHGDDLYRWGIVVRYNDEGQPGAGSCIFLHVWRGPERPTAGCTAMSAPDLLKVMEWLRPGRRAGGTDISGSEVDGGLGPILIQGTRTYLEELRRAGVLPYPVPGPS